MRWPDAEGRDGGGDGIGEREESAGRRIGSHSQVSGNSSDGSESHPYRVFDRCRSGRGSRLFAGRSQLIVQHFLFGPGWKEGCVVAASRATWPEIERFKRRMRWEFPWLSSPGSDFNHDFHVTFKPE